MNNYDNNYVPRFEGRLKKEEGWKEMVIALIISIIWAFAIAWFAFQ